MEKKTAVQLAWLGLWFVFAALLAHLLFYNPGLMINVQTNESLDTASVLVSNLSGHTIQNIGIWIDKTDLAPFQKIPALRPNQTQDIRVPFAGNVFNVKASAPFHRDFQGRFVLKKPVPFDINFAKPEIFIHQPFDISLTICNHTNETDLTVTETHNPSFFGTISQTKSFSVLKNRCQTIPFSFLPVFSGITAVFFNVKTHSFTLDKPIELNVQN